MNSGGDTCDGENTEDSMADNGMPKSNLSPGCLEDKSRSTEKDESVSGSNSVPLSPSTDEVLKAGLSPQRGSVEKCVAQQQTAKSFSVTKGVPDSQTNAADGGKDIEDILLTLNGNGSSFLPQIQRIRSGSRSGSEFGSSPEKDGDKRQGGARGSFSAAGNSIDESGGGGGGGSGSGGGGAQSFDRDQRESERERVERAERRQEIEREKALLLAMSAELSGLNISYGSPVGGGSKAGTGPGAGAHARARVGSVDTDGGGDLGETGSPGLNASGADLMSAYSTGSGSDFDTQGGRSSLGSSSQPRRITELIMALRKRHYGAPSGSLASSPARLKPGASPSQDSVADDNSKQESTGAGEGEDEWENDDDNGYIVLTLSEEEFFEFEEETTARIVEERRRAALCQHMDSLSPSDKDRPKRAQGKGGADYDDDEKDDYDDDDDNEEEEDGPSLAPSGMTGMTGATSMTNMSLAVEGEGEVYCDTDYDSKSAGGGDNAASQGSEGSQQGSQGVPTAATAVTAAFKEEDGLATARRERLGSECSSNSGDIFVDAVSGPSSAGDAGMGKAGVPQAQDSGTGTGTEAAVASSTGEAAEEATVEVEDLSTPKSTAATDGGTWRAVASGSQNDSAKPVSDASRQKGEDPSVAAAGAGPGDATLKLAGILEGEMGSSLKSDTPSSSTSVQPLAPAQQQDSPQVADSEQLAALLSAGGFASPPGATTTTPLGTSGTSGDCSSLLGKAHSQPAGLAQKASTQAAPAPVASRRQSIGERRRTEIMGQKKFLGADGVHCYFNLKVIFEPFRTGFEECKDLQHPKGAILAGRYEVADVLGSAAFSTALQCVDLAAEEDEAQWVCLKVIKNNKDFFDQSLDEIKLLQYINSHGDADEKHVLRLIDFFYCKEHLFIVSELLKENLYEFGRFVKESGNAPYYTMPRLKRIMKQVLEALVYIHGLKLIHCDIKPENIVIKSFSRCEVKLIDFGSSCFTTDHLTTYIQSRSYRAPEVILGLNYDSRIDIWSVGAVLAELHTGYVLFQNDSVATMLARIIGIMGPFPPHVLQKGRETGKYFSLSNIVYERDEEGAFQLVFPKKTTLHSRLHLPTRRRRRQQQRQRQRGKTGKSNAASKESTGSKSGSLSLQDRLFADFIRQMLHLDPQLRMSAEEALQHPWLADADSVYVSEYIIGQMPDDAELDDYDDDEEDNEEEDDYNDYDDDEGAGEDADQPSTVTGTGTTHTGYSSSAAVLYPPLPPDDDDVGAEGGSPDRVGEAHKGSTQQDKGMYRMMSMSSTAVAVGAESGSLEDELDEEDSIVRAVIEAESLAAAREATAATTTTSGMEAGGTKKQKQQSGAGVGSISYLESNRKVGSSTMAAAAGNDGAEIWAGSNEQQQQQEEEDEDEDMMGQSGDFLVQMARAAAAAATASDEEEDGDGDDEEDDSRD